MPRQPVTIEQCRKILTRYWGFTSFRPLQEDIIRSVAEGRDTLALMPTGGGKTLLACHAIDNIQKMYLKHQTGLVLWIVPSTQIYRQTIKSLKNREHPYRQVLDISSGGRTLIKEKTELFNRLDVEENLVILLLMLPSANRQNKETLKVFRDQGGFTDFFPREDDFDGHIKCSYGEEEFALDVENL